MKDINAKKMSNRDLDLLAESYVEIISQSGIEEITQNAIFNQLTSISRLFRERRNSDTTNEVVTLRMELTAALKNTYSKIIAMEIETNHPKWSNLAQKIFDNYETIPYEYQFQ
ncbi:MAG: hypothetical protein PHV20_11720 [Bacteroidales bacterium]|nr:hypothetical protein [Bacteroidales bacterium]